MNAPMPAQSRQSALIDVARRLGSARDLDELIDHILERSREVMDCEVCSILLPDGADGDLLIRSTLDPIKRNVVRVPKGKGIAGEVFVTKVPVNTQDARQDTRHFQPASDKSGLVTRAMLTIPLLGEEACLGVMQAINPNHRVHFSQDDQDLFETFGSFISVTLMRLKAQKQAIIEAEVRQQMNLAREIQLSFLPTQAIRAGGVHVDAFYEPASEVGGDFYFWHDIGEGRLLIGIGDVCGKGLPAALDMARCTTLITAMSHQCSERDLACWMSSLNQRLCSLMRAGRFIAISAMLIDTKSRRLRVCSAGLPTPKILGFEGWHDLDVPRNPPLGIAHHIQYQEALLPLGLAEQWLIYSDGILELTNSRKVCFEDDAFEAALQRSCNSGPSALQTLSEDWRAFASDATYQDDATAIILRDDLVRPAHELKFTCRIETLKQARDFVDAWCQHAGMNDVSSGLVVLACDELMGNLCKFAFCDTERSGPASCGIRIQGRDLHIVIRHQGRGLTNEDFERLTLPPSSGERIGGLGNHVIRQVFDRVDFRVEAVGSCIELVKSIC